jgi:hypothetical protein
MSNYSADTNYYVEVDHPTRFNYRDPRSEKKLPHITINMPKKNMLLNVRTFGAKGNGIDDDTAAFENAVVAALEKNLAGIFVPVGRYLIRRKLPTINRGQGFALIGDRAVIINASGLQGLFIFGHPKYTPNRLFTDMDIHYRNFLVSGLSFQGSGIITGDRFTDQTPLMFNNCEHILVENCRFFNWDFSAIEFGARCRNAVVRNCYFRITLDTPVSYGVRIFCHHTGVSELSPTDMATGMLKSTQKIPDALKLGHENITITDCAFIGCSHGIMVFAASRILINNNYFTDCTIRTISLTAYARDIDCIGNTHELDGDKVQNASSFTAFGQYSSGHIIFEDKFIARNVSKRLENFFLIKCYINASDIRIVKSEFYTISKNSKCEPPNTAVFLLEHNASCYIEACYVQTCQKSAVLVKCGMSGNDIVTPPSPQTSAGAILEVIGSSIVASGYYAIEIYGKAVGNEKILVKESLIQDISNSFIVASLRQSSQIVSVLCSNNRFQTPNIIYLLQNEKGSVNLLAQEVSPIVINKYVRISGVKNPEVEVSVGIQKTQGPFLLNLDNLEVVCFRADRTVVAGVKLIKSSFANDMLRFTLLSNQSKYINLIELKAQFERTINIGKTSL